MLSLEELKRLALEAHQKQAEGDGVIVWDICVCGYTAGSLTPLCELLQDYLNRRFP